MLKLRIPERAFWDEDKEEFIYTKGRDLVLEHSLIAMSKWEARWKKPFLGRDTHRTSEQMLDYVRCMTITQNVDASVYYGITPEIMDIINEYINDPMTATTFTEREEAKARAAGSNSFVTSELIYYWMISLNIPVEFEKWHLNRLLTLIKICNVKQADPKKMSKGAIARQNHSLNAARRARLHSKG